MNRPWDNYCTMSIVHFMAYPEAMTGIGPIPQWVRRIAEDPFFGAIEVTHIDDPGARAETRAIIEASHMQVGYGAQPIVLRGGLNPNSLEDSERVKAVDVLKACVDEAAELGADRLALLSGRDPGEKDRAAAVTALVRSLRELCAYGGTQGITIILETFDRTVDKKALVGPCDLAVDVARAVREENSAFGIMYDLSHRPLLGERLDVALRLLQPYLVHAHVGNAVTSPDLPAYGDQHPRFGCLGGANDVPEVAEFIGALFAIGYLEDAKEPKPWIAFEVKPQRQETAEEIIAGAKRVWQAAWAKVEARPLGVAKGGVIAGVPAVG